MCGIVGIIGKEGATEILVNGLSKLEYRGYDSAGIFVMDEQQKHLIKSKGRIKDLQDKVSEDVKGNIGIGHTRWATHGEANETNAHPHTSQDGHLVLVHNGVIENFAELKATYLQDSILESDTDTEIAVHLIAVLKETKNLTTKEAFRQALQLIRGSYAFALVDTQNTECIWVAKNKSPLLIGLGEDFQVICSDALAMVEQTSEFMEIHDQEIVQVFSDRIVIENLSGEVIERDSFITEIAVESLDKGIYEHYMLKEIDEQPAVIRHLIQHYLIEDSSDTLSEEIVEKLMDSDRIYIIGCGTSWHAGWASKYCMERWMNIPVEVHVSSEFAYQMPLLSEKPFFIFLSQSGETADSRQVLLEINRLNYPSLTITNVPSSTLSREADHTLLLLAGPEIAVASTKAYTAQIALLAILSHKVGSIQKNPAVQEVDLIHELGRIATAMESVITEQEKFSLLTQEYLSDTANAFYIGRGFDYYVSMESALKLKEISYIQAEGFAAGELKHGTIALIEKDTPVIGIMTEKVMGSHTRGNLKEVESRGAKTLVIAMESIALPQDQIILPDVHELLTPLISVIPTQLIAYYAALQRNLDVDKPRNLAKSVTVE